MMQQMTGNYCQEKLSMLGRITCNKDIPTTLVYYGTAPESLMKLILFQSIPSVRDLWWKRNPILISKIGRLGGGSWMIIISREKKTLF